MTRAFLSPVSVAGTLTATDVLTVPQISAGGSTGTSGQFLTSTGTGLQWATISGTGTVTSVATGTGLTGGTITTSGTLAIDTTIVPQLANANTFTASPQQITVNAAGNKGLIIKGAASQTADLQQWQDSTGTSLVKINAAGSVIGTYWSLGSTGYFSASGYTAVGNGTVGSFTNNNSAATTTTTLIKAAASQTANLTEWQNSASGVLAKVDVSGNITATSHVTTGGTSSQFVKGDGTLDSSTYLTTSSASSTYLSQTAASTTYLSQSAASTTYAPIQDITPFDDLRYQFDGIESRFVPTYQGTQVTIANPLRLFITVNGIVQSIDQSVVVWDSPLKPDGLRVDDDGYLAFSEVVPAGSSFSGRLMPGSSVTAVSTTYPFKAADLLIGAF